MERREREELKESIRGSERREDKRVGKGKREQGSEYEG